MDRVFIFIDGSNLYHGLKQDFNRTDLNFEKFAELLCSGRQLVRVHYYNAPIPQTTDPERYKNQQRFFDNLRNTPYHRVILGRLEPRGGTLVEKGVDINIAVDMLTLAFNNIYDVAILVTGDGDFTSVVEAVENLGKHVENATCPSTTSKALRQSCDKVITLTADFLKDCWLHP